MKNSTAIAIGGFDGMHTGHQALFKELGELGTIVVIETGYANLTPGYHREKYSDKSMVYLELEDIRHLDGEGFLGLLKSKFPQLKKIVVGYDFHFGKNRKYSFNDLKTLFDGEVVIVDEVCHDQDSIHSHKIRQKLQIGDIKGANEFLGHNYTLHGKLIRGQGIGAKELVATINIEAAGFLLPKEGVYVTLTRIDDDEHFHPSVSFLGHRVSTDGSFAIESHILDKTILCTTSAEIMFVAFIRQNEKFESLELLKNTIQKDIEKAEKVLAHLAL